MTSRTTRGIWKMKLSDIVTSPWAIIPEELQEMRQIYETHMKGERIDITEFEARINEVVERPGYKIFQNGIAVIEISGVLTKKTSFFDRLFFGTRSTNDIRNIFNNAINDLQVDSILLYVDSPGGNVDGTQELARTIYGARGKKPIYAFSDGMIASAAYWISSAADKIYISGDTTEVGSIGVVAIHTDFSEMDKMDGIKITEIVAGKYKRIASSNKPLTKEGAEYIQSQVDYIYSVFIQDIALFRGVSEEEVSTKMAEGKIFIGKQAIDVGLVDGVSTMDQLLEYMKDNLYSLVFIESGDDTIKTKTVSGDDTKNLNIKENDMVSIKDIEEKSPDAFREIKQMGFDEAQKEIEGKIANARDDGAKAERERIKGIEESTMPGHEELARVAKFDGKTTPGEFALKQAQAEKVMREEKLKVLDEEGIKPIDSAEDRGELRIKEEGEKNFMEVVEAYMKEKGCKKSEAIKAIVVSHPDLHKAYIQNSNKKEVKENV